MEMCLSISLPPVRLRLPSSRATYRLRLPTAIGPLHSQSTEKLGKFHKWKNSRKEKTMPKQIDYKYQFVYLRKSLFHSFLQIKLFFTFSLLQTTKLNLKLLTTLQQPWTNWLAPTMWTMVNAKRDLDELRGP